MENVKILPKAHTNGCLSAFVDFEDVSSAQKAHDQELTLGGLLLRTDYNTPR